MRHIALNFHGLGQPHQGVCSDERPYWLSVERFRALVQRLARGPDPERYLITFDDGNASDLEAAEILSQYGMGGHFFVLAGRLDQSQYLSAADLRCLAGMGMGIGLHGRDHVDWRRLDAAGLQSEIGDARAQLADALGKPIDSVAIPLGAYNRAVMRHLRQEGFAHILTSDRGLYDPAALIWNRTTIRQDMAEADITAIIEGRLPPFQRLRAPLSQFVRRHIV